MNLMPLASTSRQVITHARYSSSPRVAIYFQHIMFKDRILRLWGFWWVFLGFFLRSPHLTQWGLGGKQGFGVFLATTTAWRCLHFLQTKSRNFPAESKFLSRGF